MKDNSKKKLIICGITIVVVVIAIIIFIMIRSNKNSIKNDVPGSSNDMPGHSDVQIIDEEELPAPPDSGEPIQKTE